MKYASAKSILLINTTDIEWYHYIYAVMQVRQHAGKWLALEKSYHKFTLARAQAKKYGIRARLNEYLKG